jgi:signal transduction histidine kinase
VRLPAWTTRLDAALALAVLAAGLLELSGDTGLGILAAVLASLPLAARRHAPVAVGLTVAAALLVSALQDVPPEPLSQLVALLVAAYSLTAYAPLREAAAGAVGMLALGMADSELVGDGDHLFFAVILGVAFTAGRVMGAGRRRETELAAGRDRALADERARIARELHDVVAHGVTLMVMQAGAAQELLARDPEGARRALERVQGAGREAMADLQRMLGVLRAASHADGPQPGLADLDALLEALRGSGLRVEAEVEPVGPLPTALDLTAYRIAQEALTNALRHGAGSAVLRVARDGDAVWLEVVNPPGDGGTSGSGHGLPGMRERVALYGGTLDAGRENGAWVLRARLPAP